MKIQFKCCDCGGRYDPASFIWICDCGGLLDLEGMRSTFPLDDIRRRETTLWRYREALPFEPNYEDWRWISMGEGFSPLVPLSSNESNLLVKVDYVMPTLSFKDRGAAVLVAKAKELGVTRMIADSSGNAGTSIAAYANRADIECHIYVPDNASEKKIKQIANHGATVHTIPGSREDTAAAAREAVNQGGFYYASHVYNPFFYEGTKTFAFEIWEQMGGSVPEVLVIPVGNGSLLLGAYYGFKELKDAGVIDNIPRFVAIQAEGCAPLAAAYDASHTVAAPVVNTGTVAEGIAVAAPPRSAQILDAVRQTGGVIATAPESLIANAQKELARKGFYVEPTTAATYAGYLQYHEGGVHSKTVMVLCGAGLKAG